MKSEWLRKKYLNREMESQVKTKSVLKLTKSIQNKLESKVLRRPDQK